MVGADHKGLAAEGIVLYVESREPAHGGEVELGDRVVADVEHIEIHELRYVEFVGVYTLKIDIIEIKRIAVDLHIPLLADCPGDVGRGYLTCRGVIVRHADLVCFRTESEIDLHFDGLDGSECEREYILLAIEFILLGMERDDRILHLGNCRSRCGQSHKGGYGDMSYRIHIY